jgi:hypothetical protein
MSRPWILSFIFFLFGGGVGLLVGLSLGNEPVTPDQTGASPLPNPAPSPPPRQPVEATPPAPAPKRVARPVPARPSKKHLDAIVRGVEIPRYEGRGTITGRVQTPGGTPVEGAVVCATAVTPVPEGRPLDVAPPERDLETVVREAVERYHRDAQSRRDCTTDAEGRFTLTGIGDAVYSVRAYARGYRMVSGRDARRARAGASLTISARPIVLLPIMIASDGAPVTSAEVKDLRGTGRPRVSRVHRWSPDSPAIEFEPGTHRIQATTKDGRQSEITSVTLVAGEEPEPLVLTLRSVPGIAGRVLVADENAQSTSVHVWLLKQEGALPDGGAVAARGEEAPMVSWFRGFRFRFSNLEPGVYALGVGRRRRRADHVESVTVTDRLVERDLRLPPLDPRDYVQVRVYGPDGKAVADVRFSMSVRSEEGSSSRGLRPTRRSDGSYWVPLPAANELNRKGARAFVEAECEEYGSEEVEFTPGRDREVVIRYSATATLVVTVGGRDRVRNGRIHFRLDRAMGGDGRRRVRQYPAKPPDARGMARLGPLPIGRYELVVVIDALGEYTEILRRSIELQAGENRTSVVVPVLHSLTVMTEDCSRMQLSSAGQRGNVKIHRSKPFGKDKRVVFERLPAGEYLLSGIPLGQMKVRVPARGPVRFEPRPVNALRVEVTDAKGALARAGFRTGDLIVGIEGKPFKDQLGMRTRMLRLAAKGQVDVMVERTGRRFVIRFDLGRFLRGDKGGRVHPTSR